MAEWPFKHHEITWPDLHLGAFDGVVVAFPGQPFHAIIVRRVVTVVVVEAVQVGALVALVVPPGALELRGAIVLIMLVVVFLFGAEGHPIVIERQRVPRCTCERNAKPQYMHLTEPRSEPAPHSTELNKSVQCTENTRELEQSNSWRWRGSDLPRTSFSFSLGFPWKSVLKEYLSTGLTYV